MRTREEVLKEIKMQLFDVELAERGFNAGRYDFDTYIEIRNYKMDNVRVLLWAIGEVDFLYGDWCMGEVKEIALALLDNANITKSNEG